MWGKDLELRESFESLHKTQTSKSWWHSLPNSQTSDWFLVNMNQKVFGLKDNEYRKAQRQLKIGNEVQVFIFIRKAHPYHSSPIFLCPSPQAPTCSQAQDLGVFLCRNWITPENTLQIQSHLQARKVSNWEKNSREENMIQETRDPTRRESEGSSQGKSKRKWQNNKLYMGVESDQLR